MRLLAAVYGFEITLPITYKNWRIEPIANPNENIHILARDLNTYHLTATIVGDSFTEDERFNLEAVLSFIEHLDVVVFPANQLVDNENPLPTQLPPILRKQRRNNGGGAVISSDTLFSQSRSIFVNLAMTRLSDDELCKSTKFKILLFKCVETFRQRSPFIEITYFLLFSGLESFSRAMTGDRKSRNASKPICQLLSSYGLNVLENEPTNLPRSISTYTKLRNSLFHNSEFKASLQIGGVDVQIDASNYLYNFSMLVNLTIMKSIGFDDGHINWDVWIDRQLLR